MQTTGFRSERATVNLALTVATLVLIISFSWLISNRSLINLPSEGLRQVLVASLGLTALYAFRRLTGSWLSPSVLMTATWALCLFAASFDVHYAPLFDYFNVPVTFNTWLVVLGALACFVVAALVVQRLTSATPVAHNLNGNEIYSDNRLMIAVIASFIIGLSVYWYSVSVVGVVPLLAENPGQVRDNFRQPFWNNFYSFFQVVIVFSTIRIVLYKGWRRNLLLVVLSSASLVFLVSTTARADSWTAIMTALLVFGVLRRRRSAASPSVPAQISMSFGRRLALGMAAAIILISALWAFLYVGSRRTEAGIKANQIVLIENDALAQLYIYTYAPSLKNLQSIISQPSELRNGLLMARSVFTFFRIHDVVTVDPNFTGPNTATWLYYYYLDFGFVGLFLIPMIMGGFCALAYQRARGSGSLAWVSVYGILGADIFWSIGTERFFEATSVEYLLLFIAAHYFCRVKFKPASVDVTTRRLSSRLPTGARDRANLRFPSRAPTSR